MTRKIQHRNLCIAIGLVLLVFALFFFTSAVAQESAAAHKNPYLVRTFVDEKGRQIDEVIFPGRPPAIKAEVAMVPEPNIAMGINNLANVPAFDWSYGCSATSGAMMAGYYDRTGYANMYTGPTNSGECPMDNSIWGPGIGGSNGQCPLSATRLGLDGRGVLGHVDDYWVQYGSTEPDPFINGWPEHAYGDCTGDYMKTNQYNYDNIDGSTTFYFYTDGSPLYDVQMEGYGIDDKDGGYGLKLFFESRGYLVTDMYNQYIEELGLTYGFTFDQYKAEIDAGRPVMIHVEGHSMLGYGYSDNDQNTVYLHNTWDYNNHIMTWGGIYSSMQHFGVTIVQLEALPPEISSCDSGGAAQTFFQPDGSVYVQGSNFVPNTSYKIWIQDSPVSEGEPLVPGEDASGSQEPVTTDGTGTLSPTSVWEIPGEPCVHHDYDIIVDKQVDGGDTGKYNAASDGKTTFHVGMGGDVNGDEKVDLGDVILLHYHYVYPETYSLSNEWAGNCNCDSKIDLGDVILLHYHYVYPETYALNCCPT